jgi:PadR family transcriptional regulator, regulatory protein PadR
MRAYIGEFEQLVLLAILRLESGATGAAIRATVAEGSERTVWIGAVHTTLERLEAKGLVCSTVAPLPSARGGRRKIYSIQPAGREAIADAYQTWVRMTRGLKPRLGSP